MAENEFLETATENESIQDVRTMCQFSANNFSSKGYRRGLADESANLRRPMEL